MGASDDKIFDAFRQRYAYDRGLGRLKPVEHYQRMFRGFDEAVAREYARLDAEARRAESAEQAAADHAPTAPPSRPRDVEAPAENRVGPYLLLRELGRGGQAVVHLADDTRLSRNVALKVFAPGLMPSEQFLARFRREVELASRLDHPGICTVYEAGVDGETPYIAMRYVEGTTLAHCIDTSLARKPDGGKSDGKTTSRLNLPAPAESSPSGRLPEVLRVAVLVEKTARALHAAHEAGLIHRDVKPGNIMVTKGGEPVLLDFGLARDDEDDHGLTMTGTLLGTPAYMSPEQLLAQRIRLDRRTDVYSLGVTLYECLTLRRPFDAPTREGLYQRILASEADPPRRANPQIPKDLEIVLLTAMEKNRDRRYQTALDFAEDLRRVREHEPIHARPTPAMVRLGRWAQRRPAVATASALVFTGLVLGLVTVTQFLARSHEEQERTQVALDDARRATARAETESAAKTKALDELSRQERHARSLALAGLSSTESASDPMRALLLAREAVLVERSPLAVNQLRAALFASAQRALIRPQGERSVVVDLSPQGDRIVAAAQGTTAQLFDLAGNELAVLRGHGDAVVFAAFSPAGDRIVTASKDGTARLFDLAGRELSVLRGHAAPLLSAAFFPAGDRVATLSEDTTVRLWDLSGRTLAVLKVEGRQVDGVVISPLGDRVVTEMHGDDSIVWDAAGNQIAQFKGFARGFTPQGDKILTIGPGFKEAGVCDASGKRLAGFVGHEDMAVGIASSPDGIRFVTASQDKTARVWDAEGRQLAVLRGHVESVHCAVFSPRGDRILTGSGDGSARLFDLAGRQLAVLAGHRVVWARFVPSGRSVVTAGMDGTVRVFDVTPSESLALTAHDGPVRSVAYSPRGDRILTSSDDGTARLWDLAGSEVSVLRGHTGPVVAATYSPDGNRIATASDDHTARIWDSEGKELAVLAGHGDPVGSVAFSPQGDRVVTSSGRWPWPGKGDNTARVWDLAGKELAVLRGHETVVYRPSFSPGGDRVLTSSYDGTARLWDLAGKELAVVHGGEAVYRAAFAPDGTTFATADSIRGAGLWDIAGRAILRLDCDQGAVRWVAFTPEGDRLVTGGSDGTLRTWRTDGTPLLTLRGHSAGLRAGAVSGVGHLAATGSDDRTARIWDLDGEDHAALLGHAGPVRSVAFSPDGTRLVTGSDDATARVWLVRTDDLLALAGARIQREFTREERTQYAALLGPANAVALAAHDVVERLARETAGVAEMRQRVQSDSSLADDLRAAALRIVAERRDDAWKLNDSAWSVVRIPGRRPEDYRLALRQAELAVKLSPTSVGILNTLGVAQYRVERYGDAVETLIRGMELRASFGLLRGEDPADLAFLAMARHRLGQRDDARLILERLRKAVSGRADLDEDTAAFTREAEALVGGD